MEDKDAHGQAVKLVTLQGYPVVLYSLINK